MALFSKWKHSFFAPSISLFQSLVVYLPKTLSGGDPMSTWGKSSRLCSASLPLNPSTTVLTGHLSTTAEWNSNWPVRTAKPEVLVKTSHTHTHPHTPTHTHTNSMAMSSHQRSISVLGVIQANNYLMNSSEDKEHEISVVPVWRRSFAVSE